MATGAKRTKKRNFSDTDIKILKYLIGEHTFLHDGFVMNSIKVWTDNEDVVWQLRGSLTAVFSVPLCSAVI